MNIGKLYDKTPPGDAEFSGSPDTCAICSEALFGCANAPHLPNNAPDEAVDQDDWRRCAEERSKWVMRKADAEGLTVQTVTKLLCSHMFHTKCLQSLVTFERRYNSHQPIFCPICRQSVDRETIQEIKSSAATAPAPWLPSAPAPAPAPAPAREEDSWMGEVVVTDGEDWRGARLRLLEPEEDLTFEIEFVNMTPDEALKIVAHIGWHMWDARIDENRVPSFMQFSEMPLRGATVAFPRAAGVGSHLYESGHVYADIPVASSWTGAERPYPANLFRQWRELRLQDTLPDAPNRVKLRLWAPTEADLLDLDESTYFRHVFFFPMALRILRRVLVYEPMEHVLDRKVVLTSMRIPTEPREVRVGGEVLEFKAYQTDQAEVYQALSHEHRRAPTPPWQRVAYPGPGR